MLAIVSRDTSPIGNKVPGRWFYWNADHKFHTRLGIWNCKSVSSADKFRQKINVIAQKWEFFRKTTVSRQDFFSTKSKSSKKKESLQDEGSDTKFIYQMLPWISCKVTRNVNIGGCFSLINKSNLIVALCKIKGAILRWIKIT